jgi:parvulin-like peptidyl-prolyl isomerase
MRFTLNRAWIASLLIMGVSFSLWAMVPSPMDPCAVMINGKAIPMTYYRQTLKSALAALARNRGIDLNSPEGQELIALTKKTIVDELINEAFLQEGAIQLSVSVTTTDVQAKLTAMKQSYPSEKDFWADINDGGISPKDLLLSIRKQLLIDDITRKLLEKVTVSNSELNQFLAKHPDVQENRDKKQVSQIVLNNRAQAEDIYHQLKEGQDFASCARLVSIDNDTNTHGGALGYMDINTFPPTIYKKIRRLRTGEISRVIEVDDEFYIIKVGESLAFGADKRESVRAYLLKEKQQNVFDRWLTEQKTKAVIVVHPSLKEYYTNPLMEGTPTDNRIPTAAMEAL